MIARIRSIVARVLAWWFAPDDLTPEERLALHDHQIESKAADS